MLNQDFKELYPGREDGLVTKWETSKAFIIDLIKKETSQSDSYTLKQLDDYAKTPEGLQDAIILNLLPQLLIRRARGKNSTDVISIAEARKIFILHVTIPGDINRAVQNHASYLKQLNLPLQPTLVFVGPTISNISASYVQIESTRYLMRTPVKALDTNLFCIVFNNWGQFRISMY
ncbi:uncharacterized protein LOC122505684 [Leptopilina heterotoma]|uniref:uncharacterized protein LOC122505684 n=1 Tax=Leptopilina heterotoma TaxID=63436 RepID=UPI001CA94E2D|nr:uncharacterized protein LOC122505684 [Leptopilina heterotoma]